MDAVHIRSLEKFHALGDYVRRAGMESLNEYQKDKLLNLTLRQATAIATVMRLTRQGREVSLSMLAREMHMTASAASHLVDALVETQLLRREIVPKDHRSVRITLSPAGRKCADAFDGGMVRAINGLIRALSPEEDAAIIRIGDRLYAEAFPELQQ